MIRLLSNPVIATSLYFLIINIAFFLNFIKFNLNSFFYYVTDELFLLKFIFCVSPTILLLKKKISFGLSSSIIFCLFIFVYIPIIVFFFDGSSEIFSLLAKTKYYIPSNNFELRDILKIHFILCLIFSSFFYLLKEDINKKNIYFFKLKNEFFFKFLKIVFFVFLSIIVLRLLEIMNTDGVNFENSNLELRGYLTGFFGYIVYWTTDLIFPLIIFYNLIKKNKKNYFLFSIIFYIAFYLIFGSNVFLAILLIILLYFLFYKVDPKIRNFFFNDSMRFYLIIGISFTLIITIIYSIYLYIGIKEFSIGHYFFKRIYFVQSRNFYLYYDTFNSAAHYFFTNISILRDIGLHEITPSKLVMSNYPYGNLSAHYLSVEGIASLGVYGLILSSFILFFILRFIDKFNYFSNQDGVFNIYYFIIATYFMNINLSVILFTHGLIFIVILCFLKLEN
tara:strand:- start:5052 stop:6398 length:1347 start_codon:yes stop_codon:yes gene_type:complete